MSPLAALGIASALTVVRLILLGLARGSDRRWLGTLAASVLVLFQVVQPFLVQVYHVPTRSMEPSLQAGDFVLGLKRPENLARGSIVVLRAPSDGHRLHIKRVVGLPGDVVEIRQGRLFRNGAAVHEPWVRDPGAGNFKLARYRGRFLPVVIGQDGLANYGVDIDPSYALGWDPTARRFTQLDRLTAEETRAMLDLASAAPIAVPPGYVLVLGDNRPDSRDSRYWGLVSRDDIAARVVAVVFPFSRARAVR